MECKDQSALLQLKTMMNFEIFEIICDRSSKFNGQTLILQQITKDKKQVNIFCFPNCLEVAKITFVFKRNLTHFKKRIRDT